jgi:hypothetical protein
VQQQHNETLDRRAAGDETSKSKRDNGASTKRPNTTNAITDCTPAVAALIPNSTNMPAPKHQSTKTTR